MPTFFDHALIFVLVIALPVYSAVMLSEKAKQDLREFPAFRIREYWKTTGLQWVFVAITLAIWFLNGRTLEEVGLVPVFDLRMGLGAGICALLIGWLVWQQRAALRNEESAGVLRKTIDSKAPFLPHNRKEYRHFSVLAVTAGTCEEVLYRGYLYWYLSTFLGTTAAAWTGIVFIGAVVFALAHFYQGRTGMIQVFFIAAFMGGIYLLTRSLWVPMLAHALIDLNGGLVGVRVYSMSQGKTGEPCDDAAQQTTIEV